METKRSLHIFFSSERVNEAEWLNLFHLQIHWCSTRHSNVQMHRQWSNLSFPCRLTPVQLEQFCSVDVLLRWNPQCSRRYSSGEICEHLRKLLKDFQKERKEKERRHLDANDSPAVNDRFSFLVVCRSEMLEWRLTPFDSPSDRLFLKMSKRSWTECSLPTPTDFSPSSFTSSSPRLIPSFESLISSFSVKKRHFCFVSFFVVELNSRKQQNEILRGEIQFDEQFVFSTSLSTNDRNILFVNLS